MSNYINMWTSFVSPDAYHLAKYNAICSEYIYLFKVMRAMIALRLWIYIIFMS